MAAETWHAFRECMACDGHDVKVASFRCADQWKKVMDVVGCKRFGTPHERRYKSSFALTDIKAGVVYCRVR